jgi:hypothetical protein
LESSRCSCSLCSSQGAGRYEERWGHGEVIARCAGGPRRRRPEGRSFKTE